MEYYPAPPIAPDYNQLYTPNYVADTKLEYLIILSHRYRMPIEHLPHHLGPNYWIQIVLQAIIAGDLVEMDRIMIGQRIPVDTPLWKNLTPIWFAAQYGHFHIVQNLLLNRANVNIYDKDIRMSCLDIALQRKYKRCAYLLLAYGARSFNRMIPKIPCEPEMPLVDSFPQSLDNSQATPPEEKKE